MLTSGARSQPQSQPTSPGDPLSYELLPDALRDALAQVIADKQREWQLQLDAVSAEARATIAELRAETATLRVAAKSVVDDQVARVTAAVVGVKDGAPGRDGRDAEPVSAEQIAAAVAQYLASHPPINGADGKDGADAVAPTAAEIAGAIPPEAVEAAVAGYLAENPPPAGDPGQNGRDGADGKDADPSLIKQLVAEAVAMLPEPKNGRDGADGAPGRDGKDADPVSREQIVEAVAAVVDAEVVRGIVVRHLEANPPPAGRDGAPGEPGGIGAKGEPGRDGRDGLPGVPGNPGEKGIDGKDGRDGKDGSDGRDGFGFDDLTFEYDGDRAAVLRFVRGEHVKQFDIRLPIPIDRGIYREGQEYEQGDVVGFGGSAWSALRKTAEKPDLGAKDWRLLVKKGRDGKDGTVRHVGPPEPVKLR